MLAGADNNQQQNRAQAIIERVRNAYNNTGKIKKFGNVQKSVSNRIFSSTQFSIYQERKYQVEI
ncbi:MAG: hypothetical protein ACR5LA_08600 [Wolbachia sp.]